MMLNLSNAPLSQYIYLLHNQLLLWSPFVWVNMFCALIYIGNYFFPYKSHRKLMEMSRRWPWWRWHFKFYLTMALPNCNAWCGFWSLCTSGQQCFCITLKKYQKLYKLNEFYNVRRWPWIKLTFLKIQILWHCTLILYRVKSLHPVIIVLPGTYWKIAAVFRYSLFCKF